MGTAPTLIFSAPPKLENSEKMFGFNIYSLQTGVCTDEMRKRLPPTDSRLRKDLQAWELQDQTTATVEKNRLESNQKSRILKFQEEISSKSPTE